jgi:hypothetical protein
MVTFSKLSWNFSKSFSLTNVALRSTSLWASAKLVLLVEKAENPCYVEWTLCVGTFLLCCPAQQPLCTYFERRFSLCTTTDALFRSFVLPFLSFSVLHRVLLHTFGSGRDCTPQCYDTHWLHSQAAAAGPWSVMHSVQCCSDTSQYQELGTRQV